MARARSTPNGRLEEAMTALTQAQATLVQNQASLLARLTDTERENAERFARIEQILLEHSRILAEHSHILAEHSRLLERLPDAIREKIGFQPPPR